MTFRKDTLNNNFQNKKKTEYNVVQDWISANGTKIKPTSQSSKMSTNCVNKPLLNVYVVNILAVCISRAIDFSFIGRVFVNSLKYFSLTTLRVNTKIEISS